MLAQLLLWATTAHATEVHLVAPQGDAVPGQPTPLHVVVHDNGVPVAGLAPEVAVTQGSVEGALEPAGAGTWRLMYRAPAGATQPGQMSIRVGSQQATETIELGTTRVPSLTLPALIQAGAGRGRKLIVPVVGLGPLDPGQLVVAVGETSVVDVESRGDGTLELRVELQPDPFPRAIPLGVVDRGNPLAPPAWTVLRLTSRPRIPVRTDPGATVRVEIGGRAYGPTTADEDGLAIVSVEVRPGERQASIQVVDIEGNTQQSAFALGGDPAPSMAMVVGEAWRPGERPPTLHLRALDSAGRAWRGDTPVCSTSTGTPLELHRVEPGLWGVEPRGLRGDAIFDLRVDCRIGTQTRVSAHIPVDAGAPAHLGLRAYPGEVTAELPRTELQAVLENHRGDRLPATGITIEANHGRLYGHKGEGEAAYRVHYDGRGAFAFGSDTVVARWDRPPGEHGVRRLQLSARGAGDELSLAARALDDWGRPVVDVALRLQISPLGRQADGELHQTEPASTDAHGWARWVLPARSGLQLLQATTAMEHGQDVVARVPLFPGQGLGPDPDGSDLTTVLEIPVFSGRVRSVIMRTEPANLVVGSGPARIHVELLDRGGAPVVDEPVELGASRGVVTRARLRSDGSWEASYAPPPGILYGKVQITARSARGTFSDTTTELTLVPRPVTQAPGLFAGWIKGGDGVSSPWVDSRQTSGRASGPCMGGSAWRPTACGPPSRTSSPARRASRRSS